VYLLDVPVSAADLAPTLSADEVEKLIAASSSREHITLRGASGSRLGIDWTRQIVYVRDCNTDRGSPRVIDDTLSVPSTLTVRAHAGPEGADVEVDLRELTIDAIPSQKFGKIELQSPIVGTHHASTRFTVPRGKAVVVKLSGSREEGEERTVRLMLVRVAE
jgi:hypothetical protein